MTVTFTPVGQGWDWILVGFGFITLLGISVLLYMFYHKSRRAPSEMSSGSIVGLISLATFLAGASFVYSLQSSYNLEIIEISKNHIRTPFGKCDMIDVKSIYFYPDSIAQQSTTDKSIESYLIIEEDNGHRHPLSSKSYDIEAIHEVLIEYRK